jgi:hypothetical protein
MLGRGKRKKVQFKIDLKAGFKLAGSFFFQLRKTEVQL